MSGTESEIRNRFFALKGKLKRETVSDPELGEVVVQELDAAHRAKIETMMFPDKDAEGRADRVSQWKLALVAFSVVDPSTGSVVFDRCDIDALGKLPARSMDRIFHVAFRLSGFGADAIEKAEGN